METNSIQSPNGFLGGLLKVKLTLEWGRYAFILEYKDINNMLEFNYFGK
jgi:hypothetical protein